MAVTKSYTLTPQKTRNSLPVTGKAVNLDPPKKILTQCQPITGADA